MAELALKRRGEKARPVLLARRQKYNHCDEMKPAAGYRRGDMVIIHVRNQISGMAKSSCNLVAKRMKCLR